MKGVGPAIRVHDLSKHYQIGQLEPIAGSFREMLAKTASAPFRRFRRLGGDGGTASFWALRELSFEVQAGEVVGVIGRNGAGKSTLLKILSRITEPTRGRVELRGRIGSLLEVGTGFHPDLTGRENIFLNGAILGMSRAEIRGKFDAIVDFADVAQFLETPVKHYSSGMYLRLAFAVAAHLDGEILLVDEVLAVGDVAFQKKCLGKMQDVSRTGRTVLFISHNMAAVAALCSRGIVLNAGCAAFDGRAGEAVRFYLEHHLAEASSEWDLAKTARASGELGESIRLDSVRAEMARAEGFLVGEPLRFRVDMSAASAADHVACAIGLDDMYGSRVVTFMSEPEICAKPGDHYGIDLMVPAFGLLPGKYMLSVSLFSGGQYLDYLVHFGAISVLPLDRDGRQRVEQHVDRGSIAVPSMWRIRSIRPRAMVS
jgi:lipopolysaccharide transport system ATP-binding protein